MARITEHTKNHLSRVVLERAELDGISHEESLQQVLGELQDPLLNQALEEAYYEGDTEPETPSSRRRFASSNQEPHFGADE
jgi:hypothetical protein